MQRYTIFFITVNALLVSDGFSAHHQELKNYTHSIGYMSSLFAATASVSKLVQLTHASGPMKVRNTIILPPRVDFLIL